MRPKWFQEAFYGGHARPRDASDSERRGAPPAVGLEAPPHAEGAHRALDVAFGLVDETGVATTTELARIAGAVTHQIAEHFAPAWGMAPCAVHVYGKAEELPKGVTPIALLHNADQADALGYHDVSPTGQPYARIFVGPIIENGGAWLSGALSVSQTVSHEILEALGDLYCNLWAQMPGWLRAVEMCDMVESDFYQIDGVSVSNFLLPSFFAPGEPGPYDHMGTLETNTGAPRPDCYEIRMTGGKEHQVYGETYPDWRRDTKHHPAARTARRVRASLGKVP